MMALRLKFSEPAFLKRSMWCLCRTAQRLKSDSNEGDASKPPADEKSKEIISESSSQIDSTAAQKVPPPTKWVVPSRADPKVIKGEFQLKFDPKVFKKGVSEWFDRTARYKNPFKDPRLHYKQVDWYPDHHTWIEKAGISKDPKDYMTLDDWDESFFKYPHFRTPIGPDLSERVKLEASWLAEGNLTVNDDRIFPKRTDVLVVGGGIIGASIAHWITQRNPHKIDVVVIDKDLRYEHSPSRLNIGGIRQQFGIVENCQMARFGIDFIRNYRRLMRATFYGDDWAPPDIEFHPQGYLVLADENYAETLLENHRIQTDQGSFVDILTPNMLKKRFPWLNTEGIVIGSHGVQDEGWINPWNLLIAFKGCAEFHGAKFVECELIDFNLEKVAHMGHEKDGIAPEEALYAIVRTPQGHIKQIAYSQCVIAAGAYTGTIAQLLKIGDPRCMDERRIPCPIEPRKRYVYQISADNGPVIDCPVVVDYPTRFYCRREGLGGMYICGKNPTPDEEPDITDMSVDNDYFYEKVLPILQKRFPTMKNIRLVSSWSTYSEHNYWDSLPIIGDHPYYDSITFACGFEGYGVCMAPAVGRAIMELTIDDEWRTLNLERLGFDRIVRRTQLRETAIF